MENQSRLWFFYLISYFAPIFFWNFKKFGKELDTVSKSLIKILKEPKNSLIKQYKRLFEFEDVELEFKDDAISEIANKAISKKTGARGLRSILENILLKTMYDLPSQENIKEVIVDAASVKGQSQPIIVHSESDDKSKPSKTSAA